MFDVRLRFMLPFVVAVMICRSAGAQETAPYPNGTSGLKAGTVPPPGYYWLMYNRLWRADRAIGPNGEPAVDANGDPLDLRLTAYANVHRFLHSTDHKILGADFSWNFVVPVVYIDADIENFGMHESDVRIADMNVEPFVIEWHQPRFDFGYLYGFFAPTAARDDAHPALPGKNHWTHYVGAAGTYYFNEEREWSASFLSRYEISLERKDKDITAGDNFSFEWGLARNFDKVCDVGVSGYCSWQLTLDRGADVTYTNVLDRIFGLGPEIQYFSVKHKLGFHFRYWWEFGARDRPEGAITTLTVVKAF
jgi:hypothetical protein